MVISTSGDVDERELRLFRALDLTGRGHVRTDELVGAMRRTGLSTADFRLRGLDEALRDHGPTLDLAAFQSVVRPAIQLVEHALQGQLVLPEFGRFTEQVDGLFDEVLADRRGEVASYIPQLARVPPDQFGLALCTIDGQRHERGDASVDFCLQSTCKPVNYCLALEEHGEDYVHRFVGREPSGVSFNELKLAEDNRPHNPMINAGAIMSCSLVRPGQDMADRFDYVVDRWRALAGGRKPRYNNAVYLSERATADRNFALGYFMREKGAFPPGTELVETLEFYFQCCAIEFDCRDMAVVAATLANGGVCPVSGQRVLRPRTVQNCLSLMYSCGMYDFSGEFAFAVGLPAKSGVAGALLVVVPNVMGFCVWSPRLDQHGNSVRGVQLCQKLVRSFNFHNYDNLTGLTDKVDPRVDPIEARSKLVQEIVWASSKGDLGALARHAVRGDDLEIADYDARTPLHLAAAEGQAGVVTWLLEHGVQPNPRDRWGGTPLDDASEAGHDSVVAILEERGGVRSDARESREDVEGYTMHPTSFEASEHAQLIWAAALGDVDALRRLVARGTHLDVADYDLRTPLHLAAAEGHREIVAILLAQGVNPWPRDRWGRTPADDARLGGHHDVVEILEAAPTP